MTLKGFIIVPEADLAGVLNELPNHIALTKKESGCLVFNVTQDGGNQYRFDVYEEFESKASFEKHQERVRASKWGEITINVERSYQVDGL